MYLRYHDFFHLKQICIKNSIRPCVPPNIFLQIDLIVTSTATIQASMSSEDTHMTWTEDRSTPSSGHLIDDYYCNTNNSYNEESDQDVFLSPDIATSGSTAILSHYDPLGAAACCSDGYEKLHGDNSTEKMTCDENSSNTTAQALRHLGNLCVSCQMNMCQPRVVHTCKTGNINP